MRGPDPHDIDRIVAESEMAPEDGRAWSHSSIPGGWWVPEQIAIEDEQLCWVLAPNASLYVEPTPDLLEQFLRIQQAEDWKQGRRAILDFARTWGPLHLCSEHARPVWHRENNEGLEVEGVVLPVCPPVELEDGRCVEPLWQWISYSYLARDVVHASTLARSGKSKPKSDRERHIVDMLMVKPDRQALVAHVHRLIEDGMGFTVLPEWTREAEIPGWRAEVRTLAAALGVALWNILRASRGVAICANCHTPFSIRERRQRYCDEPACERERKRVDRARARATKAASIDPEYVI